MILPKLNIDDPNSSLHAKYVVYTANIRALTNIHDTFLHFYYYFVNNTYKINVYLFDFEFSAIIMFVRNKLTDRFFVSYNIIISYCVIRSAAAHDDFNMRSITRPLNS